MTQDHSSVLPVKHSIAHLQIEIQVFSMNYDHAINQYNHPQLTSAVSMYKWQRFKTLLIEGIVTSLNVRQAFMKSIECCVRMPFARVNIVTVILLLT